MSALDFEKPILELEAKIAELRNVSGRGRASIAAEIDKLEAKAARLLQQTYGRLSPAQKVLVARHTGRPHFLDYVRGMIEDFTPLAGDRLFAEDHAMIGGLGRFRGRPCVVMGQEKGGDTQGRIKHNFGMARPEGYRKARRLMELAERFSLPVISLVDTAGAWPGIDAEERGQSEAIARSIESCLSIRVPTVSVVIGEGGSGGAVAIAAMDRVYMLEHAIYSVISPEGCASILWRSAANAAEAAAALCLTAQDLLRLGLIEEIVAEPLGGAHRDPAATILSVAAKIETALKELGKADPETLPQARREKFLRMGRAA